MHGQIQDFFQLDFMLLFTTNKCSPFHKFHPTEFQVIRTLQIQQVCLAWEQNQELHTTLQYTQAFIKNFISNLSMKNNWPCCCSHLVYYILYYIYLINIYLKKYSKSLGGSRQLLAKNTFTIIHHNIEILHCCLLWHTTAVSKPKLILNQVSFYSSSIILFNFLF